MNSKERHERRYQRRVRSRQQRRILYSQRFGGYDDVFSYRNLYESGKKCCRGVMWKNSTQSYIGKMTSNTFFLHQKLRERSFHSKGFHCFDLVERGKLRHIKSVHISERVVQRCLCDYALVPVFSHSFIYDNAASLKGKGVDFAMDRVNQHLHRFYRRYGVDGLNSGYVLVGDFSDYFNSAPHGVIYRECARRIHDPDLIRISCQFMEDFGDVGYGLGSQVSQIDALMVANPLDHFIKEKLGIKHYGRYMDDFYLIHKDKDYLRYCLNEIRRKCEHDGLKLNRKKTRILPLRNGFKFLKTKFILTETGRVVRKVNRKSSVRMRMKLRKFFQWAKEGRFELDDVEHSYQSWRGHMMRGNSTKILRKMDAYYNSMICKCNGGANYVSV